MVRTKNTARKPSAGLPTARRPYVCQHCRREINDLSNYRRHLAIVHGKKDDGTGADDSTVARFSRYAKRGPLVPVQSAPSADDTSRPQPTTSDEKPTTSTLAPSAATRRRRRQPKSVEIVESSSPSPPAVKRTATTSDVADDLALSTSTSRPTFEAGSTDDMFVDITDEEAATEIDLPTSRVPTRPLPVAAPHLRRVGLREAEDAVAVRPPATSVPTVKRRRLEMAPSVLACTTSHCEPSQVQSRPRR